ncbi:hypothetical protein AB0I99_28710 [Streptomyces spongiicola]
MALRARIVLWAGEGRRRRDIAELAGVSARTVDRTSEVPAQDGQFDRRRASTARPRATHRST